MSDTPLLQQSLPIRERVVQLGKRAAFPSAAHLVHLTDRHSSRTATGALRRSIRPTPGMHGPKSQLPRGIPQGFCFVNTDCGLKRTQ